MYWDFSTQNLNSAIALLGIQTVKLVAYYNTSFLISLLKRMKTLLHILSPPREDIKSVNITQITSHYHISQKHTKRSKIVKYRSSTEHSRKFICSRYYVICRNEQSSIFLSCAIGALWVLRVLSRFRAETRRWLSKMYLSGQIAQFTLIRVVCIRRCPRGKRQSTSTSGARVAASIEIQRALAPARQDWCDRCQQHNWMSSPLVPVSALIVNAAAVLALNFAARGYADGPPPKPSINYQRTPGTYDRGRCWNWPWAFHHRFAPHVSPTIPSNDSLPLIERFPRQMSSVLYVGQRVGGNFFIQITRYVHRTRIERNADGVRF